MACGPSTPSTVAVQFLSEGSTLSGIEFELAGTGYRISLVKKRFITGELTIKTAFNFVSTVWPCGLCDYIEFKLHYIKNGIYVCTHAHTHKPELNEGRG